MTKTTRGAFTPVQTSGGLVMGSRRDVSSDSMIGYHNRTPGLAEGLRDPIILSPWASQLTT